MRSGVPSPRIRTTTQQKFADLPVNKTVEASVFTGGDSLHHSGTPLAHCQRKTTGMTVLIVDDSPQFRELIRTVLAGLVDEVNECADGDEAVAAYGAQRPDWVLMDLQMARMGGLEATRRILAADRTARVLIVTDYDDAHWRAAAIEAGACGYVLKDNLLDVRRLLEPRRTVLTIRDERSFTMTGTTWRRTIACSVSQAVLIATALLCWACPGCRDAIARRIRCSSGRRTRRTSRRTFVAVIDFDRDSRTYGKVLRTVPLDGASAVGNEPHHVGLSRDGRTLALGGLLSVLRGQDQVFFFDVSDPRHPTFIRSDNPPEHPSPTSSPRSATAAFS